MAEPVDAADVLAEALPLRYSQGVMITGWQSSTAIQALHHLSERAGGGGFACMPDGDGSWTLHRVEVHEATGIMRVWFVPVVKSEA